MGLEGFDLGVPPGQLLLVEAVELVLQLRGHLVEGVGEVGELPAAGLAGDLPAQGPLPEAEGQQQKQQQREPHGPQQIAVGGEPGQEHVVIQGRHAADPAAPSLHLLLQNAPARLGRLVPLDGQPGVRLQVDRHLGGPAQKGQVLEVVG